MPWISVHREFSVLALCEKYCQCLLIVIPLGMTQSDAVRAGRQAYSAGNWQETFDLLSNECRLVELEARDIECLGDAAYLIGKDEEALRFWTSAHNAHIDGNDIGRAARVGILISLTMLLKGELSQCNGWIARIERLLEPVDACPAEREFLRLLAAIKRMFGGDPAGALPSFDSAIAKGSAVIDADLLAIGLLCRGQALVATGDATEGAACLDEAMVCVTSGQVSPILSGVIYCAVILTCQSVFDSERAREWTGAFDGWCRTQPDLVPFRGQCLIHRSEILQMTGDWPRAMEEADRACHWLADRTEATAGRAQYQKGEMHRLTGELETAGRCFARAFQLGYDSQPGRALLRLAANQAEAAAESIRAACGAGYATSPANSDPERLRLLGPSVEICLSAGQIETAIAAAEELSGWAGTFEAPLLLATSAQATGAVLAATGEHDPALKQFSEALDLWQRLSMPYEAARTRARLSALYHALGDDSLAEMHRAAAQATFSHLGAVGDLSRLAAPRNSGIPSSLTHRQIDVLRLLSVGRTNREIAEQLGISEHTVARHVSNIFDKTGVSSRTAAASFAHRHGLIS